MKTYTEEEFKKKYGQQELNKFSIAEFDKKQGMFTGTQDRLAEVGLSTADTIKSNIQGTGEFADQSVLRRGVQATAAGFSTVPRGAFAMAPEPVRTGIQKVGDVIGKGFGAVTNFIADRPSVQQFTQDFPEATKVIEEVAGTLSAGGEIAGNILGAQGTATSITRLGSYTDDIARSALKSSDDVLIKVKNKNIPVKTGNFLSKATNDVRFKLSDIDPQVETVLKRSNFDEVNTYFQQAKNAKTNPAKPTPLEIAGSKAESAYDVLDEARRKAIEGKKTILANVADQRVSGNTINEVMSNGIQRMNEKFGVQLDAKGNATPVKGRASQLDATDAKLINEYFTKLNSLGVSPTVRQVDDFVDWAQSQLYKQSKTMSKLETASDPVVRQLQGITGDLNGKLKTTVGNGYGETNARISTLIELQDELSRALGADARKGGGLMKTLFSPAGGNTRRIFQDIQDETGIDLFKEATLAKYAMENVGDVRQASLLKQLDVATKSVSKLDFTKPGTLIDWLRENADLDGQQLANEILRRQNMEN